jgi:hypothetical protein
MSFQEPSVFVVWVGDRRYVILGRSRVLCLVESGGSEKTRSTLGPSELPQVVLRRIATLVNSGILP